MSRNPPVTVKVWGNLACFTRPEAKVERVSYPVMTPSAARGILEAIFWKPEFSWHVEEIRVLRPIRYVGFLRNEVKSKIATSNVRKWMRAGKHAPFFADDDRTQRHTLALRDVAYVIAASVALRPHATEDEAKYRDQFRRSVARGRCFHRPYLGCREFAAHFAEPDGERPIDATENLGRMLFDIAYHRDARGRGTPLFFEARLERGVLRVPREMYEQLEGKGGEAQ